MSKLELLNVFVNDRLTAAAEDIFRAVKDTVLEYQSEMVRSREENERLRRLLSVAVQRLLLQPEPHSVQSQEDGHPSECEGRSSVEALPYIKQEPTLIQTEYSSQEVSDSERGSCGHDVEPPSAYTVCSRQTVSPAPLPHEVKPGTDCSSVALYSKGRAAQSPSHASTERRNHMTEHTQQQQQQQQQQGRALKGAQKLDSNNTEQQQAKAALHILQIHNVRSLKAPPLGLRSPHQSQRWHSCKECGKVFSFACQLEVHMRWHTKEKPYSCAVCRKSFTTVSMLKRHQRIHTGEKPFRCHVCGKCFNQSAHLNTHFRMHSGERASWSRDPHAK